MDNFNLKKYLAEGKLFEEEQDVENIQDELHGYIDELAALLAGWYLSYDMEPHSAWDNQIFASSAYRNSIKDTINRQSGANKEEKLISFWKNSEKHYGMEGKAPDGDKKIDSLSLGKVVGKNVRFPDILKIQKALSQGQRGNSLFSIIQDVTGIKPETFFQNIK